LPDAGDAAAGLIDTGDELGADETAGLLSAGSLDTIADDADCCDVEVGVGVVGIPAANAITGASTAHKLIHHRLRKWYLFFRIPAVSGLNSIAGIKKKIDIHVAVRPIKAHNRKKIDKNHNKTFFPFKAITSFV
jgi:hypothetical protein